MQFHSGVGYFKRQKFPELLKKLTGAPKEVFDTYLMWRNTSVTMLDYNLLKDFVERVSGKVAGDNTERFLCESLKEAMDAHSTSPDAMFLNFRRRFDGAWWKRVPKNREAEAAKSQKFAALQESLQQRQAAGQTYRTSSAARLYGQVHRTSGHA
ncbi:MAG: hypothetical protein KBC33_02400 [Candidatus Pacebacteria bacterium]|nr:hypothetical protein [Candidatus Paceibacterota bacterium]